MFAFTHGIILCPMNLESNALTGDIPSELGELNALRVLAMGGNALAGPIPTQIGNLGGLVNLGLGKGTYK